MVRLASEGLRSVGVEPPSPHPRACALSCPSLAVGGPGRSSVGQPPVRGSLLKPAAGQQVQPPNDREGAYHRQRCEYPEEHSEHALPSLACCRVQQRIVTHGWRSCNNVVAILANALYCPWPRFPSFLARPMLCPFQWLRRIVDDAAMSAPGGSNHRRLS